MKKKVEIETTNREAKEDNKNQISSFNLREKSIDFLTFFIYYWENFFYFGEIT